MNKEKKLQIALMLADAAEGCQTAIESLKLAATALDDTANLLRDAASEDDDDEDPPPLEWGTPDWEEANLDWEEPNLDWEEPNLDWGPVQ